MCECQGNPLARVTLALGLPYLLVNRALLSACLVAEVCQASNVFLTRKEPLSMTLELSKSMRWSNDDHACFAMFDALPHVLTFLTCSFLRMVLCDWCYIGETGWCFETRKREHVRMSNAKNIAKHAWSFNHRKDLIKSRFLTSIAFFLNNSHLIYTSILCFCCFHFFSFPLFLHIFCHFAFHFYRSKAVDCRIARKLISVFNKLFSQRTFLSFK